MLARQIQKNPTIDLMEEVNMIFLEIEENL